MTIVKLLDHTEDREIVKPLDDTPYPPLLDHVGVALWQAAQGWKAEFDRRMIAEGFDIFGQAASNVLAWIGPLGLSQSQLAQRMGITKQAAQQFTDTLEQRGIVQRHPDPRDARAHLVVLTAQGKAMMTRANAVKLAIEDRYRDILSQDGLAQLKQALTQLRDTQSPSP